VLAPVSALAIQPAKSAIGALASFMPRWRMTASHVRRDKAALFQRVQAPPGDRSSRKQPEQGSLRITVTTLVTARVCRPQRE
jgi:hypothetical protein